MTEGKAPFFTFELKGIGEQQWFSPEEFLAWVEAEMAFWQPLHSIGNASAELAPNAAQIWIPLKNLKAHATKLVTTSDPARIDEMRKVMQVHFNDNRGLASKSSAGQFIKTQTERQPLRGLIAAAILSRGQMNLNAATGD